MPLPRPLRGRRRRRAVLASALAALAVGAATANASAEAAVSSNWSGYSITGTTFSTVSGQWIEPTANCSSLTAGTTASAFWVGLGGDSGSSNALEQTGTEADCLANGTARYSAWYELVPRPSVKAHLKVSAGDTISASVDVLGTSVTLKLADLTTHASFSKTETMSAPDISSAEWIAEAPSALTPNGTSVLPLTDFGSVSFSKATALSTDGKRGTISAPAWSATRIELRSTAGPGGRGGPDPFSPYAAYDVGATDAVPSLLSAAGEGFSVTFHEEAASASQAPAA